MVRLLFSLSALLSVSVFGQDLVQNVSGQDGRSGYSGGSGGGFSSAGAPASQPSPGAHAKHLNVWVRAVENAPGVAALDFGNENRNVDLSQIGNVVLVANGGAGGNGGDGGEGGNGQDGSDGASCGPFWAIPTSGENGGEGGNGGPGTSGADGGDAGDIQVNVEEEDMHLVAKMNFSAQGGEGGRAGRDGSGGRGGQGGRAGQTSYYDFNEGKQKYCIAFVSDGRNGSDGYSPRNHLNSGRRGRDGRISIRVHRADGSTNDYADVFKLSLDSAVFQEENKDGVIEPGEKVKLMSLGIRNEGNMPSPGSVALTVTSLGAGLSSVGTEQIGMQRELAPGQGVTLDLSANNFFFTVTGQVEKGQNAQIDLGGLKLSVPRKFAMASTTAVQFGAPSSFTVGHPSTQMNLSYANISSLPRGAKIKIVNAASFIQLDKLEFTQELAAGEKRSLSLLATPTPSARFGSTGNLQLQFFVTDFRTNQLKQVGTQNVNVSYQPPQGIESVNLFMAMKPLNVYVTFPKGKATRLSKLWVKKASGTTISVQYEIDNFLGYNSPVYQLSMEEVAPLLGTLASRQQLSRDQVLTLLKQVKNQAKDSWAISALK